MRTLLSKRIRMRSVPAIRFYQDMSITEGMRISNLVSETLSKDKERAEAAGRSVEDDNEKE